MHCPACGRANPADASFCMGCGGALVGPATTREVRKTVTALFCDLVGSTTLGETHDPEVLRPVLHAYFEQMRAIVERHGGRVEKFIGDAVSAVFGLPLAHEDDALRAVRAAMEMTERLETLNEGGAPVTLAARIGVTTGEVLVPVGTDPLIGDTLNTAARLQGAAEPGKVLIGDPTWRLVRDAVVAEPVEPLILKGKAEPVPAFRVLRVASRSPMRTRRLDAPMIGRAQESALLRAAYHRAVSDRACQLVTVLGTAGAGKSRLVEDFLGGIAAEDVEVLRGHCLPYGEGIAYYPITESLRAALDLTEFAGTDAVRAALGAALEGEEHAAELEANLLTLFGAGAGSTAEETAWAVRRFLEARTRTRPLVLVLDDVHWGEPTFLDLVEYVADWSRDAAILLLCMARPDLLDIRPGWGGGKSNAMTISLAPLSETDTDALIDGLLGSTALPSEARGRITAVAEGNPLFVEEMLRMLVDDGRLVRENEAWVIAGDLAGIHVPPTVSALLSARLDRLAGSERDVVEAASVAGRTFHRGAVAALLPEGSGPELATHLRALVRKELIAPERSSLPGEDAYRFRHLLIRDTAYDAIPKSARSELHRAFAEWFEAIAGERVAERGEVIGYHLERAHRYREELGLPQDRGLRLRAARSLGGAGALALDRGDIRGAIDLLRRAAELATGDPVELTVLSDLASALLWAGRPDDAAVAVSRLALASSDLDAPAFAARARVLAFGMSIMDDPASTSPRAAAELVGEALRAYREEGATRFEPEALLWLSNIAWSSGDSADCLLHARQALDIAMDHGDRSSASWAVNNILASLELGPVPLTEAVAQADAFLERFAGQRWVEVMATNERAYLNALLGRTEAARADAAAGRAITEALGFGGGDPLPAVTLGFVAWTDGDLDAAVSRFREAISRWEAVGDRLNPGAVAPSLARALIELGRDSEAAAELDRLGGGGARPERASFLSLRGHLAARRGLVEEAERLADDAVLTAGRTDFLMLQGDVALDRAEILGLAGRPDEAQASATEALVSFERKEYALGIRRAEQSLARLASIRG